MRTERRRHHSDRRQEQARRHAAKREQLLESAIRVVRREGPSASMEAIAREAGITKPIVYRAFGDRDGLTAAVAERFSAELAQTLREAIGPAADDRSRVAATIDAYLAFIEADPAIVRFLIHSGIADAGGELPGFVRNVAGLITETIGEELRARGRDSGAAEPWAYAIVGAVHLAGDWWLERRTMPRERLVEYLTALVFDGLAAAAATGGDG